MSRATPATTKPKPKLGAKTKRKATAPKPSFTSASGTKYTFDSLGEMSLFVQLLQAGVPEAHLRNQHKFHEERNWRFDIAVLVMADRSKSPLRRRVGIEIDGNGSGHTGFVGYRRDREKEHAAILAGWTVLRFVTESVLESDYALKTVLAVLGRS